MKKYLPFLSGLSFVAVIVAVLEYISLKKTGGHVCYPLDDTFIHMAVSKNLALYGNWGLTPTGFVSTSSSPLFTIVLALFFKLFSVNVIMPFVVSSIGTVLILLAIQQELNNHSSLSVSNKVIVVIATLLAGAIPAMTLLGMEHSLQIAFTLFFVHSVANLLTSTQKNNLLKAAGWAILMTATRYENTFFIVAACALFVFNKNWKTAFIIAAAGALPLVLFGNLLQNAGWLLYTQFSSYQRKPEFQVLSQWGFFVNAGHCQHQRAYHYSVDNCTEKNPV